MEVGISTGISNEISEIHVQLNPCVCFNTNFLSIVILNDVNLRTKCNSMLCVSY